MIGWDIMKSENPIVYTCFCTDNIHEGHINILKEAAKLYFNENGK